MPSIELPPSNIRPSENEDKVKSSLEILTQAVKAGLLIAGLGAGYAIVYFQILAR